MQPTLKELRALVPPHGPEVARVPPGRRADIGTLNWVIAASAGRIAGTGPLNVFTTLSRHRGLFRRWLVFASALMPGGVLPRQDTELVILRVSANARGAYEWHQHTLLALKCGVPAERIAAIADGPGAGGWTPRQDALLRCCDELHATYTVSDETWGLLRAHLDEREVIELFMLIGNYAGLAMTMNGLGIQVESPK